MRWCCTFVAAAAALSLACIDTGPRERPAESEDSSVVTTEPDSDDSAWAGDVSEADGPGSGFVNNDAAQSCGDSCDIWSENDCARWEKCTAVACEVGSYAWDSHVCRDVHGDQKPGEPCSFVGDGLHGIDGNDDCAEGAMCWNQDPDTGLGTCLPFCEGTPSQPTCPHGGRCNLSGDGIMSFCFPDCDPLAQDCDNADLCLPDFNDTGFVCLLDASGGTTPYGTPCEFANSCNPGLICIAAELVPEPACESASGCCSPMCDINAPNTCPGEGQLCESLYEPGMAPGGSEHVGVCAVPQ